MHSSVLSSNPLLRQAQAVSPSLAVEESAGLGTNFFGLTAAGGLEEALGDVLATDRGLYVLTNGDMAPLGDGVEDGFELEDGLADGLRLAGKTALLGVELGEGQGEVEKPGVLPNITLYFGGPVDCGVGEGLFCLGVRRGRTSSCGVFFFGVSETEESHLTSILLRTFFLHGLLIFRTLRQSSHLVQIALTIFLHLYFFVFLPFLHLVFKAFLQELERISFVHVFLTLIFFLHL